LTGFGKNHRHGVADRWQTPDAAHRPTSSSHSCAFLVTIKDSLRAQTNDPERY